MSKQETIKILIFLHGKPLPSKKWWLHEDGEIIELEGVSFANNSDYWWFLDENGEAVNIKWDNMSADPDDYPAIHQDLLFENKEDAKAAASSYCQDMVSRYNNRFVQLVNP